MGQLWVSSGFSYNLKALPLPQTFFSPALLVWKEGNFGFTSGFQAPVKMYLVHQDLPHSVLALTPYSLAELDFCTEKAPEEAEAAKSVSWFVQVMLNVWPDLPKSFTLLSPLLLPGEHPVVKPLPPSLERAVLSVFKKLLMCFKV